MTCGTEDNVSRWAYFEWLCGSVRFSCSVRWKNVILGIDGRNRELLGEVTLIWVVLIAVIIVAAMLIVWIRARCRGREDREAMEHQLLMQMRELHREGDLTEKEFRSIKGRFTSRMNDSTHKL